MKQEQRWGDVSLWWAQHFCSIKELQFPPCSAVSEGFPLQLLQEAVERPSAFVSDCSHYNSPSTSRPAWRHSSSSTRLCRSIFGCYTFTLLRWLVLKQLGHMTTPWEFKIEIRGYDLSDGCWSHRQVETRSLTSFITKTINIKTSPCWPSNPGSQVLLDVMDDASKNPFSCEAKQQPGSLESDSWLSSSTDMDFSVARTSAYVTDWKSNCSANIYLN